MLFLEPVLCLIHPLYRRRLILARFPAWDEIEAWMSEEGLAGVSRRIVDHYGGLKVGRAVLEIMSWSCRFR